MRKRELYKGYLVKAVKLPGKITAEQGEIHPTSLGKFSMERLRMAATTNLAFFRDQSRESPFAFALPSAPVVAD